MKKIFLLLGLVAVTAATLSSCDPMKRDCQGVRHERLKNGVYL